jgi:hypothetical protein
MENNPTINAISITGREKTRNKNKYVSAIIERIVESSFAASLY